MQSWVALAVYLAPAGLVGAALAADHGDRRGAAPRRALRAGRLASGLALALAAAAAVAVGVGGPVESPVLGVAGAGFSIRLDALSVALFGLVALVGFVVLRFSERYLDGDPGQGRFVAGLSFALAGVLLLVLSGNLAQLVAAWIATSLALHRLLLFYPERPRARLAARRKFVVARIGDAFVIAATACLVAGFGSWNISEILAAAREGLASPSWTIAATTWLALAAMLKSAQFPTHGWLLEVVETPTPVSALLHAGIINAGGFLVLRFAELFTIGGPAAWALTAVGGFTALFGSLAMLAQTSVKVSLAYSTVGQMGFMLFECGIGAYSFALLHLVAHSLYKAHAFLASGSAVELYAHRPHPGLPAPPSARAVAGALATALATVLAIGAGFGLSVRSDPASLALAAVLALGLAHGLTRAFDGASGASIVARAVLAAAMTSTAYFLLEHGAQRALGGILPHGRPDLPTLALLAIVLGGFAATAVGQSFAAREPTPRLWAAAYVHLRNGLYAQTLFDRLVDSIPGRSRRPGTEVSS